MKDSYRKKYQDLDKEVKKIEKRDKKGYIKNLTAKAEEAVVQKDLKTLLTIAKTLRGGDTVVRIGP